MRKQFPKSLEQSTKLFDLYNINPDMRASFLPSVKIKISNGISSRAVIDSVACDNIKSNRLLQEILPTEGMLKANTDQAIEQIFLEYYSPIKVINLKTKVQ